MNLEEFKSPEIKNPEVITSRLEDKNGKVNLNSINSLDSLEQYFKDNYFLESPLLEGQKKSNILFIYGKCSKEDKRILDGQGGQLFDKMLSSIQLSREKICLASYIPRGLESYSEKEEFLTELQLLNYKLIELIDPKYLIIMSNYCIKMILATDLSSMSLRGKWFDFNTPNDTTPKKCRVLYEPEILINNPDLKKDAWEDLKDIKRQLGG